MPKSSKGDQAGAEMFRVVGGPPLPLYPDGIADYGTEFRLDEIDAELIGLCLLTGQVVAVQDAPPAQAEDVPPSVTPEAEAPAADAGSDKE